MTGVSLEYVKQLASQLPAEERRLLAEHLISQTTNGAAKHDAASQREDLYGLWRGKVDEDFDIEKALYEIRHEWEKELEEFGQ